MIIVNKLINYYYAGIDLNFFGIVVSMADGVATVIGKLASFGEVQVKKCIGYSLSASCGVFPLISNLQTSNVAEEKKLIINIYIGYVHEIFFIFMVISCVYCLINYLYLVFGNNKAYYLERIAKSYAIMAVTFSFFFITSPHSFYKIKIEHVDFINNVAVDNFFISIVIAIPFIFFILTILITLYDVKFALSNSNEVIYFENTLLYIAIWMGSFYCLYKLEIISLVLSVDKSLHSEFASIFLTKCHFRIFIVSLTLPLISFIFVIGLKCLSLFNINRYKKIKSIFNNNIKSVAFAKWYTRMAVLFFVSVFYTVIFVYGSNWGKPFNLLYTYKDCIVVLSSLFIFPIFNVGRVILSGAVVSRSGNFEAAGSSANRLLKNFERQYSIYPRGSPQYRLMSKKFNLFSKLISKDNIDDVKPKSLLERVEKLKGSQVRIEDKVDIAVEQTNFMSNVKTGVVASRIGVGADLILSKDSKTIKYAKKHWIY